MKNLFYFLFFFLLLGHAQSHAQCNPDLTPPVAVCVGDLSRDVPPSIQIPITVNASDFNAGSYDACDPSNTLGYFIELAPQSSTPPSTTSLTFTSADAGDQNIVFWVVDAAGNAATCNAVLHLSVCQPTPSLTCNDQVTVELGVNGTYELFPNEILEGGPYCDYSLFGLRIDQMTTPAPSVVLTVADIGLHQVSVSGIGAICWGNLVVTPGTLNSECPQLYVSMGTSRIRPCITSWYNVHYVNGSTFNVADSYVDVTLDEGLVFQDASIPATSLGNQVYRFATGDLDAGQSGSFNVSFTPDCDAPVGTTYCSEAHIYPEAVCAEGLNWSGAEISVTGTCINDSIHLQIHNIGTAAMAQQLGYVVVEDVLMRQSGTFNLASGQTFDLQPIAGAGPTYRLEVQQEPGYPYGGAPSVSIEGCGGFNPGMVTIFPTENSNPSIAIYCRESVNSFDPNDKQALPKGYGGEHFIDAKTPLEYMIRFQNTGTDTAYKVVLLDTLSSFLDPKSIRMGASSHPYKFDLLHDNILRITFDNILLPHKAVNEPGSQGFVQFTLQQTPNNADGTEIKNTAAIYFDFNAPVITNQTFHTVGSHFISVVATNEPGLPLPQLEVYPNPSTDVVYFNSVLPVGTSVSFALTDARGRLVDTRRDVTLPLAVQRGSLQTGTYFFRFTSGDGRQLWTGKLLVK